MKGGKKGGFFSYSEVAKGRKEGAFVVPSDFWICHGLKVSVSQKGVCFFFSLCKTAFLQKPYFTRMKFA